MGENGATGEESSTTLPLPRSVLRSGETPYNGVLCHDLPRKQRKVLLQSPAEILKLGRVGLVDGHHPEFWRGGHVFAGALQNIIDGRTIRNLNDVEPLLQVKTDTVAYFRVRTQNYVTSSNQGSQVLGHITPLDRLWRLVILPECLRVQHNERRQQDRDAVFPTEPHDRNTQNQKHCRVTYDE